MNKPRVLMLGWEIPPHISGGLGVACFGICQALASKVELTIIFPRADPRISIKGAKILGLDQIDLADLLSYEEIRNIYSHIGKKEFLFSFSPYIRIKKKDTLQTKVKEYKVKITPSDLPENIFRNGDNYDQNINLRIMAYAKVIALLAEKIDFDLIHAHDWMTFAAGVELKRKFNKPLVLHIHSLDYDRVGPIDSSWLFELEKEAMIKADLIIPVSNYTGSILEEHYRVPKRKIYPVHNAIEDIKKPLISRPRKEKIILFVGRITHQKGPQYFLKTSLKVLKKYKSTRFIMVGDGDFLKDLMHQYEYKDLKDKIEFTGHIEREKVFELMAQAHVFCMTSVSEPFGIAALEAAQLSVPVLLSKRAGVAEVLSGALTVDHWNTDLMADQIVRLLKDKTLREKCISKNLQSLKKLTWDNAAKRIVKAYDKL